MGEVERIIKEKLIKIVPSRLYLKRAYYKHMGKSLNLKDPQTFNEKIQWLKLYDHNPKYTMLADKYAVKEYIKEKLGEEYLIPLVGGPWKSVEGIDYDSLPEKFVLKCTHDAGSVIICKNKKTLDSESVKRKLNKQLKTNFYYWNREWAYKNIEPQIIAEKYMEDDSGELNDYKFMCFNQKVKAIFVCSERFRDGVKVTWYNTEWKRLPFTRKYPASDVDIKKPKNLEKMIELAECLSEGIPFVRIDFYEVNGRIYFGEFTFYPGAGLEKFTPEEWDYKLGEWLQLPFK